MVETRTSDKVQILKWPCVRNGSGAIVRISILKPTFHRRSDSDDTTHRHGRRNPYFSFLPENLGDEIGLSTIRPPAIPRHPSHFHFRVCAPFYQKNEQFHYTPAFCNCILLTSHALSSVQTFTLSNTYKYARDLSARTLSASARTTFSSLKSTQESPPSFSVRMCAT